MSVFDSVRLGEPHRLLIVDDDAATRLTLKALLEQEGHVVKVASNGQEALARIEEETADGRPFALVLADLHLGDMSGLEVLARVRGISPETQAIMITGHADVVSAIQALRDGVQEYLLKPYHIDELKVTVAKLLRARSEAVRNAELLAAARKRASELAVLNRIGQTVTKSLDLDQVLSLILEQIIEALRVEAGSIALLEHGKLVFRVASGPAAEQVKRFSLECGQGLMGYCVAEGEPLMVNEVGADSRHFRLVDQETHFCTRSVLCVPMRETGSDVIGAIEAINPTDGEGFAQDDLDLLQAISVPAAVAVENAKLHRSLAERASELARAVDELREADRLKSEFVQNVSHELRTPLTFVKGYVELLQNRMLGPVTEQQAQSLALVADQTDILQRLVDDIILMQEYKLDAEQLRVLSLGDILEAAIAAITRAYPDSTKIECRLHSQPCYVKGHAEYLAKVFYNLLDNAAKFDPNDGPIRVELDDLGKLWQVRVTDQGIGIPIAALNKVFERFYQVDGSTTRRFRGAGLGLAVAKEIVEAHGGSIWVESSEGGGSTFGVLLPKVDAEALSVKPEADEATLQVVSSAEG